MKSGKKTESLRRARNPSSGAKLPGVFKRYFWDVVFDDLTIEKYPVFIAERLLNYADLDGIKWLLSRTDRTFIKKVVDNSRNLNPKTKNYWEIMLSKVPV